MPDSTGLKPNASRACPNCGRPISGRPNKIFCSPKCRYEHWQVTLTDRRRNTTLPVITGSLTTDQPQILSQIVQALNKQESTPDDPTHSPPHPRLPPVS